MKIVRKTTPDVRLVWNEKTSAGAMIQKSFAVERKKAQQMLPEMKRSPYVLNPRIEAI